MKSLDIYSKYTIKRVNDLRDILCCEYNSYRNYMYKTTKDYVLGGEVRKRQKDNEMATVRKTV